MTLNPDCVRDTLFFLEDHLFINSELEFSTIDIYELDKSLDYPIGELSNTLLVLDDGGFIQSYRCDSDDSIEDLSIYRITYSGYEFIEHIRPETVWDKIKNVGTNVGSLSIDIISQIAVNVITQLINGQLGL